MRKIIPAVLALAVLVAFPLAAQKVSAQEGRTSRFAVPVSPQQAAILNREEDLAVERAAAIVRDMQAAARTAPEKELAARDARIVGEIRRIVLQRQAARASAAANLGGAQSSSTSSGALMAATQQMQELQMSFNLQYLMLQENMQNESREYAAMSNILKTKHETATGIIGNIK